MHIKVMCKFFMTRTKIRQTELLFNQILYILYIRMVGV